MSMFRMLYMWSGSNRPECYIAYRIRRSSLCMWTHLQKSCQKISVKMRLRIGCPVLFMEKLVLMFGIFVCV